MITFISKVFVFIRAFYIQQEQEQSSLSHIEELSIQNIQLITEAIVNIKKNASKPAKTATAIEPTAISIANNIVENTIVPIEPVARPAAFLQRQLVTLPKWPPPPTNNEIMVRSNIITPKTRAIIAVVNR